MDEIQKQIAEIERIASSNEFWARESGEHLNMIDTLLEIISQQSKRVSGLEAKVMVLEQDNEMLEETVSQQAAEIAETKRLLENELSHAVAMAKENENLMQDMLALKDKMTEEIERLKNKLYEQWLLNRIYTNQGNTDEITKAQHELSALYKHLKEDKDHAKETHT